MRENQRELEEQAKISAQEKTQNINDFTEKLSEKMLEKLATSEKDLKHELLRLEGFLEEGRFDMKTIDCVLKIVNRDWLSQNCGIAIGGGEVIRLTH